MQGISRRTVLTGAAALGAIATSRPARAAARQDRIIINGLGGIEDPNLATLAKLHPELKLAGTGDVLTDRVWSDLKKSGVSAVNVTLGYVAGPDDPFESTVKDMADTDRKIRANPGKLMKVLTSADILTAKKTGQVGLIYGFQNSVQIGKKAERVDLYADLGLRILQLTYNPKNDLGGGSLAGDVGLTDFGREVMQRAEAKKVLLDLSHSGERTCLDAARAAKRPIGINHTGCRALQDVARNKTDEEMRAVADTGGVIGIYFMPFLVANGRATAADVVAHIEHALQVCGEDHVSLGTDGTITQNDDLDAYRAGLKKEIEERRAAGISAAGENENVNTFVIDLRGPDQFHHLAELLVARGHSQTRIDKILGGNLLRLYKDVWGA
ncbi:MAG TPA: membrane dipeptidase [Magnetospirillaceae bacterium]|nr:membrane dipeptidase [Magnetospirillaceae bacterium]